MSLPEFRLFDFQTYNRDDVIQEGGTDDKNFTIKMFGMNEQRETCCIHIENFHPFFYVLIPSNWEGQHITQFKQYIRTELGDFAENSLLSVEKTKMEKLYGFNNHKKLAFLKLSFKNEAIFNKTKKLWYTQHKNYKKTTLKKNGLLFERTNDHIHLYEASLPPLLRYFHIQNISPSGWIGFNNQPKKIKEKHTSCHHEFITNFDNIVPLLEKEDAIPMKIMSYDIEASSSHGDFPVPIKTYKKLIGEIIQHWTIHKKEIYKMSKSQKERLFIDLVCAAFKYGKQEGISRIYLYNKKDKPSKKDLIQKIQTIIKYKLEKLLKRRVGKDFRKDEYWEKRKWESMDTEEQALYRDWDIYIPYDFKKNNIVHVLGMKYDAGKKLEILDKALEWNDKKKLNSYEFLPKLEGDKCTFIGSTFLNLGEREPYYNNMIALGECSDTPDVPNSEIVWKRKEKNVLLEWTKLVQKEDPDIIIGYNIFGFDWKFLIDRAKELKVLDEFLVLGRNKDEKCEIKETSTTVASGTYELVYVKIPGRIQIDLYNYFRKNENLPSYKLDYVASYFIGDLIKDYTNQEDKCIVSSKNLTGLKKGHYICFEIIGHSSDKYKHGKKFIIEDIDFENKTFVVNDTIDIDKKKKIRWCLAKDDVTPQDIFRLSNEGPDEKAIVAKYCFQDCNLVHNLLFKNDIFTAMVEQANICSVPIDFVAMRGQGIKLLSFIAKECATKKMCMPVMAKNKSNDGYEGAIVLPPKPGLYINDPVAVCDYSSLYPSCMISENISHDSKVWTKEYNLDGKLIKIIGEQNNNGDFIYDNLDEYKYVNITYDTYKYIRKTTSAKVDKIICGKKICRFAQFPNNEMGILPTVLEELLASRKATRKLIKYKTITTNDGKSFTGLISREEDTTTILHEKGNKTIIENANIASTEDTYDDFMKNVFDKRQSSKKIVANSLYGQCGAKTSSFYDKDIAASTTAVGRKLLLYGKRIVEECYGDIVVETKNHGKVKSNAEYVYGDSVTGDTPLLLRNKNTKQIEFKQINDLQNDKWMCYDGFKAGESNRKEKQQKYVDNYEIYTSNGWSKINRVIRHKTTKKIYRVTTHTGTVDVTEDHSLLDENLDKLKPKDAKIGIHLCHKYPSFANKQRKTKLKDFLDYTEDIQNKSLDEKRAFIYGFFFGDGSCGKYDCPSGLKYSWALNNADYKLCSKLQSLCIDIFGCHFKINNTLKSSGVFKIVPCSGINSKRTKYMCQLFRTECYNNDKLKIVPIDYLNATDEIKFAYLSGYYAADGSKCKNEKTKNIRLSNKGKIGSAMLFYMFKSIGFNVSVNTRKDKLNITRLTVTSGKQRKHPHVLKKIDQIYTIENNDFVYDIETETGNFNTGYPLIVKNTDSVFFSFKLTTLDGVRIIGKTALEITIELAIEAGKLASKFLKGPHDLEYEKTFDPFLLLSKKRYVGMLYETDVNKCKMKSMGIVLKRRDNAACVKDCYGEVVDILMKGGTVDQSVEFVKGYLQNMVDEKIDISKLIITKSLNGFYKNPEGVAHKVLADRMGKRDSGNKPSVGSRIPYVYIKTKGKVKLQGERIEDPDFIKKNNLKPDYSFYITNQIMKPVMQIFNLVLEDMTEFTNTKKKKIYQQKLNKLRIKYKDDEKKYDDKKSKLRDDTVKEIVFNDALRISTHNKTGQKSIMSFFG